MTIREKITEIIEQNCPVILDGDTKTAAQEILKHLNNLLDLDGNGWFDDDKEMLEIINC